MAYARATKFDNIVEERLPVWTILSELFLDTELVEADIQRIAGALSKSPYSVAEIGRILRHEVLPAFVPNLLSVAGEWCPWSEAEVRDIMERSLRTKVRTGLTKLMFGRLLFPEDWGRIAAQLR